MHVYYIFSTYSSRVPLVMNAINKKLEQGEEAELPTKRYVKNV